MFPDDDVMGGMEPAGVDLFLPASYDVLFTLVPILIVIVLAVGIATTVRRAKKLRDAGIDPLGPGTDLAIRLAHSRTFLKPPSTPTLTQRLAELDDLHRAGTITSGEREAARARLLGTI